MEFAVTRQDVALEAQIDRPAAAAAHPVPAPTRMHEGHVQSGETGQHEGLGEGGVETLVGNAVALEDDAVAILEEEVASRRQHARAGRKPEQQKWEPA